MARGTLSENERHCLDAGAKNQSERLQESEKTLSDCKPNGLRVRFLDEEGKTERMVSADEVDCAVTRVKKIHILKNRSSSETSILLRNPSLMKRRSSSERRFSDGFTDNINNNNLNENLNGRIKTTEFDKSDKTDEADQTKEVNGQSFKKNCNVYSVNQAKTLTPEKKKSLPLTMPRLIGHKMQENGQTRSILPAEVCLADGASGKDFTARAIGRLSRGIGKLLRRTNSVRISDPDPVYKVAYLGNVLTGWARGVTMREKRGGAMSKMQKLRKRLSLSFGRLSTKDEPDGDGSECRGRQQNGGGRGKLPYNGYSEECLDRLEPNGNIPHDKEPHYEWSGGGGNGEYRVRRQLSVSSDSKLLDEGAREEARVVMRPKRPPRPKSEAFLGPHDHSNRRTKRFSAFGGDSPFGKSEAYIKLEQLGEGSYATVYKGYSNLTQQVVALKEIRLQEEEGAPFTAIREASLLKELKHANIVTLHDIVHTRETLTFVFEFVDTDLSQYMERHPGGLNHHNVRLYMFQLLRGLSYCHRRRVLHRDVKPQNLLISSHGELKLADFGLARAKSVPSHTYSHEVVTLWYRPPDVLLGSTEYSTSLDMWGVGCIFVEMLCGVPTFPGVRDTHDQLDKIFKVVGTPTEESWSGVSRLPGLRAHVSRWGQCAARALGAAFPRLREAGRDAERLASALLQPDPTRRLPAQRALHHAYFASLPPRLRDLPDEVSIFTVEGVSLHPETRHATIK